MKHSHATSLRSRLHRGLAWTTVALAVAQGVLALGSWVASALWPEWELRSLLDGEGIRWFFAHFTQMVGSKGFVWLLLMAIAVGCARESGFVAAAAHPHRRTLRERSALSVAIFFELTYMGVIAVLIVPRRAVLLGVDGSLWPSPFSEGLVPLIAFALVLVSVVYGLVARKLSSVETLFRSLYVGLQWFAPMLFTLVMCLQFAGSLLFVLG